MKHSSAILYNNMSVPVSAELWFPQPFVSFDDVTTVFLEVNDVGLPTFDIAPLINASDFGFLLLSFTTARVLVSFALLFAIGSDKVFFRNTTDFWGPFVLEDSRFMKMKSVQIPLVSSLHGSGWHNLYQFHFLGQLSFPIYFHVFWF